MADANNKSTDGFGAWIEAHPAQTIFGGFIMLAVLAFIISSLVGDDTPQQDALSTTTTTTTRQDIATTVQSETDADRPEVPQLTCQRLITEDEADAAIYGENASGPRGMFVFGQGETCVFDPDDDSGRLVRMEPGDPADLAPGAELGGVAGEAVTGVGDAAAWFDDAATGTGVLAVGVDADPGVVIFRIHVARPDVDSVARLDVAQSLALAALPRFPGVTVEEPEVVPDVITFAEEPVDLPPWGLDDILYAGVDSGEWSLGEGLVTVLEAMANGTPGAVEAGLTDTTGSWVVAAAQSYIESESGSDADRIRALLEQLLPSPEELDRLAPAEDVTALPRLIVAAAFVIGYQEPGEGCDNTADNPCFVKVPLDEYDDLQPGKYSIYVAQPSDWTTAEFNVARDALRDAAVAFEKIGQMPATSLVLRPGDNLYASYVRDEDCRAGVGDFLVSKNPTELKQILAREIAFCFISSEAYPQLFGNPNPVRWLVHGLANYLSGVVYPNANVEHQNLPDRLAQEELSTTMLDRSWTNWILFEHIHGFIGAAEIMDMIRSLPAGGDLAAALAASPGMPEFYHDLERALSDANVSDIGIGRVPYEPQAWELPVGGPIEVPLDVPRFGVRRLHIEVPAGQYACPESFSQGAVRMSWRPGAPGDSGSWSDELPVSFSREAVMVLSSVQQGASYTLEIIDLSDDPECPEEEPSAVDAGGGDNECLELCDPSTYYWGDMDFEP